jgi:hypothetical protein
MKAATAAIAATAGRARAAAEWAPALVALTVGAAAEAFIEPEAEWEGATEVKMLGWAVERGAEVEAAAGALLAPELTAAALPMVK